MTLHPFLSLLLPVVFAWAKRKPPLCKGGTAWRSQKSPAAGSMNPFTDVSADAYYADAVLWAVKESVTNGTSSVTFSPDADCTRAQIVTFIWRTLAR